MTNPAPRPALRKAPDADVHLASAGIAAAELPDEPQIDLRGPRPSLSKAAPEVEVLTDTVEVLEDRPAVEFDEDLAVEAETPASPETIGEAVQVIEVEAAGEPAKQAKAAKPVKRAKAAKPVKPAKAKQTKSAEKAKQPKAAEQVKQPKKAKTSKKSGKDAKLEAKKVKDSKAKANAKAAGKAKAGSGKTKTGAGETKASGKAKTKTPKGKLTGKKGKAPAETSSARRLRLAKTLPTGAKRSLRIATKAKGTSVGDSVDSVLAGLN